MARSDGVSSLRNDTSLRLPCEFEPSGQPSSHNDLDGRDQTLVDTRRSFKAIQAEFLEYVQHKKNQDDDSLSQFSYCVNDSIVDKQFTDVYTKGKVLGEGGFAFVYQCRHTENKRAYAVKECIKQKSKESQDDIKDEIAALRQVKESPLFVRLLDVFHEPDCTYLVMEEMKGGDLLDKLTDIEIFEEWEARRLIRTLLEAVAYCHKRRICHRDIKPENILLPKAHDITTCKLGDFGCAHRWKKPNEMDTLCGSPQYVAPEVVNDRPIGHGYSSQVDLWSCGVVLYIILGGYAPFESDDEHELLDLICEGNYEFHDEYWHEVEEAPKELISKLLVVNPLKRLTARQALNSPWLRRRDSDWIKEMDDSQSSFDAWLEKRNSMHTSKRDSLNASHASLSASSFQDASKDTGKTVEEASTSFAETSLSSITVLEACSRSHDAPS